MNRTYYHENYKTSEYTKQRYTCVYWRVKSFCNELCYQEHNTMINDQCFGTSLDNIVAGYCKKRWSKVKYYMCVSILFNNLFDEANSSDQDRSYNNKMSSTVLMTFGPCNCFFIWSSVSVGLHAAVWYETENFPFFNRW